MIESSLPQFYGPHNPEPVECFRHEGEDCSRCDGSGYRLRRYCAGCGEPAGSISVGTGAPLVGKRGGRSYHVNCQLGATAGLAMLERMGS